MFLGEKIYRGNSFQYRKWIDQGSGLYYYDSFSHVWIKNPDVNVDNLEDSMLDVFKALEKVAIESNLRGFIITSGNDSKHMKGSYHYKNRAVDISTYEALTYPRKRIEGIAEGGVIFEKIRSILRPNPDYKKYDVVWETDHIHIEYDPGKISSTSKDVKSNPGSTSDNKKKPKPVYIVMSVSEETTLDKLIDEKGSLLNGYESLGYTREQWFKEIETFDGGTGVSNKESVENSYPAVNGQPLYEWPDLPFGSSLMIPSYSALRDIVSIQGVNQNIDFYDLPLYKDAMQRMFDSDPNYVISSALKAVEQSTYSTLYDVEYIDSLLKVWVFCKADNKIHDITHICSSVSFESGATDNFSISLAFMRDKDSENSGSSDYSQSLQENVIRTNIRIRLSDIARLVSENDIVWIRFEDLKLDSETKEKVQSSGIDYSNVVPENSDGTVPFSAIAGRIYDFIGLVSAVTQGRDFEQGDGSVSISGGSIQKMFLEDEATFLPIAAVSGKTGGNLVFGGQNSDSYKRMFISGEYAFLFAHSYRNIENTMKFYLNILANTGFVPDLNEELFSSYSKDGEDRRTHLYNIDYPGDFLDVSTRLAKGIYQIVKLSIDPAIAKRYLLDSTVANPSGNLMSLFQKVCAWPLVEILMDTYGDMFVITCRVPPFAQKQILEYAWAGIRPEDLTSEETQLTENDIKGNLYNMLLPTTGGEEGKDFEGGQIRTAVVTENPEYIITVKSNDVSIENLQWETNFYTWYQIEMSGSWLGGNDTSIMSYIPILYLSEYVERWGSRKMEIVSLYSVAPSKIGNNYDRSQAVADLLYAVETTAYLPFTRRGTIVLNRGDRRIKKGMWIRYIPTDELFYVDSVSQSLSVDEGSISRTTIINVSRGLKRTYIDYPVYNYFNIVDLPSLKKMMDEFVKNPSLDVKATLKVNKDVFDFFVKRSQFEYEK